MRLWRIAVLVLLVVHTSVMPCAAKCGQAAQNHACCAPAAPSCCAAQMSAMNRANSSADAGAVVVHACEPARAAAHRFQTMRLAEARRDVAAESAGMIPLVLRT